MMMVMEVNGQWYTHKPEKVLIQGNSFKGLSSYMQPNNGGSSCYTSVAGTRHPRLNRKAKPNGKVRDVELLNAAIAPAVCLKHMPRSSQPADSYGLPSRAQLRFY